MGVRKWRDHLHATRDLGYSYSSLVNWVWPYLRPTSFIERILSSSRLCSIRHDLGSFWWSLSSLGMMTQAIRLLEQNISPAGSGEKYLIPIPTPEVVQTQGIKVDLQSHLVIDSLKSSWVTTRVLISYQCFFSTLASMLPKSFIYVLNFITKTHKQ